ncbi:putative methyltransferase PMT21 [Cocos nucifera]|nr:putative methyltransferase PMT21 [Cocos nucifera]
MVEAATNKTLVVTEARMKAVEEFRTLDEFKAEVIEFSPVAYEFGFDACKALVAHFFSKVDISQFDPYLRIGRDDRPPTVAPLEPMSLVIESAAGEMAIVISLAIDPVIDMEAEVLSDDF